MLKMNQKGKGGRPPVSVPDKRRKRIICYVNNAELRQIDEARQGKGSRAAYIRGKLFDKRLSIHKTDSEILSLMSKVSVNVNQIAKRVNTAHKANKPFKIIENELNDIKNELRKILFAIIEVK